MRGSELAGSHHLYGTHAILTIRSYNPSPPDSAATFLRQQPSGLHFRRAHRRLRQVPPLLRSPETAAARCSDDPGSTAAIARADRWESPAAARVAQKSKAHRCSRRRRRRDRWVRFSSGSGEVYLSRRCRLSGPCEASQRARGGALPQEQLQARIAARNARLALRTCGSGEPDHNPRLDGAQWTDACVVLVRARCGTWSQRGCREAPRGGTCFPRESDRRRGARPLQKND
jgi:hypothetical protein